MSPRLAASMALLAASVGLSACGSSSKITVTQRVTSTVTSGGNAPGTTKTGSSHRKSASGGNGTGTAAQSSQPSSHSGSAGSSGSGGSSSSQSASGQPAGSSALAPTTKHLVDNTERVHITARQGALIIQEGVVTGPPIGNGTIVMRNRLTGTGVITSFTVKAGAGSIHGFANATLQVQGSNVHYRGTARITGGTGRYSRVRNAHLTVIGSGSLSGDTTLRVTGTEWY